MCAPSNPTHVWPRETSLDRCRVPASAGELVPFFSAYAPTAAGQLSFIFAAPSAEARRVRNAGRMRPLSMICSNAPATQTDASGSSMHTADWDFHT
ncbi:hypothetical protein MRX96_043119 [Rhipicephalus microplus]